MPLVTSYVVGSGGSNENSLTTPQFAPAPGEVLVAKLGNEDDDNPAATAVSGGGLVWVKAAEWRQGTGDRSDGWIYAAAVGLSPPAAMSVTSDWTAAVEGPGDHAMIVERWTGVELAPVPATNGLVTGYGAPSATVAATVYGSPTTWLCVDWLSAPGVGVARGADGAVTADYSPQGGYLPPRVAGRATGSQNTDSTAHPVTLPAGVAGGDMLVVSFSSDSAAAVSLPGGSEWQILGSVAQSTTHRSTLLWKISDGSDGLTVYTAVAEQSTHVSLRIPNGVAIQAASSSGVGTSGSPSSPTTATVTGRATGGAASSLAHTVPLPAGVAAGEAALVLFGNDTAVATASTSSAGWVSLGTSAQGTTTNHRGTLFYAANAATAAALVVDLSAAEEGSWATFRVAGAGAPLVAIAGAGGGGSGTNVVFAPITVADPGNGNFTTILCAAVDSSTDTTLSQTLTWGSVNWINTQTWRPAVASTSAAPEVFTAEQRLGSITTSIAPAAGTLSLTEQWVAFTVAFPDGTATGGSVTAGTADPPALTATGGSIGSEVVVPTAGLIHRMRPTLGLADGASVASVPSETGGLTLTQGTAGSRPVFVAAGAGGKPALRFDGVADYLTSTAAITTQAQPLTIAMVLRPDSGGGDENVLHIGGVELLVSGSNAAYPWAGTGFTAGAMSGTAANVVLVTYYGASSEVYLNGVRAGTGNVAGGGLSGILTLGRHPSLTDREFTGDVYEYLIWNRVLTAAERDAVASYAASAYAAGGAPADRTWITSLSLDTSVVVGADQVLAPPGGFGNVARADGTSLSTAATVTADTTSTLATLDPAGWAMSVAEDYVAWTIAVSGAATATGGAFRMYAGKNEDPYAAGNHVFGMTAPAGQAWTLIGIELLPAPVRVTLGVVDELEEPRPVVLGRAFPIGVVSETETVAAVTAVRTVAGPYLGVVDEVEDLDGLVLYRQLPALGAVDETEVLAPLVVSRIVELGVVETVEEALPLFGGSTALGLIVTVEDLPPLTVGFGGIDIASSRSRRGLPPVVFRGGVRVMAQQIISGEWVHRELPVSGLRITRTLSGPQAIAGSFDHEITDLRDVSLMPWGTWIHVEEAGDIRASGILLPGSYAADGSLELQAQGPSAYAARVPFTGDYSAVRVDPADVVRMVWAHVQSFPRGNLGVSVVGSTPVRIGEPEAAEVKDVDMAAKKEAASLIADRIADGLTIYEDWSWQGCPEVVGSWNDFLMAAYRSATGLFWDDPGAVGWLRNYAANQSEVISEKKEPYRLHGYELPFAGKVIDQLGEETPFEWVEDQGWADAGKNAVYHRLRLGYPQVGSRLDLNLTQGENVLEHAPFEEPDDVYADSAFVQGKGEGADAITGFAGVNVPSRLRMPKIVTDKTIATSSLATARAHEEIAAALAAVEEVTEIAVNVRHENSEWGTFDVGDTVLPRIRLPWLGFFAQWHRITQLTYAPDDGFATLSLSRRDGFRSR